MLLFTVRCKLIINGFAACMEHAACILVVFINYKDFKQEEEEGEGGGKGSLLVTQNTVVPG